jgi:hypothetical protein
MFIAVLMENFEIAEEDKRQRQVQNFMERTENERSKKNVISRWNIYRYFRPKPKGLNITSIPNNLLLSVQKNIVREFMNESTPPPVVQPVVNNNVCSIFYVHFIFFFLKKKTI